MQPHSCYLCHSKNTSLAFKKLSHEIWICNNCSLYFLKFDYDYDKFIHDYYQKGYFTGNKKLRAYADYEGDQETIKMNMRNYLKKIINYCSGDIHGANSKKNQNGLKIEKLNHFKLNSNFKL